MKKMNVSLNLILLIIQGKDAPSYKPVVNVASTTFDPKPTIFKTYQPDDRGRQQPTPPTPSVLMQKYWDDKFTTHLCNSGNAYRAARLASEPNLHCWSKKSYSHPFTNSCIYHFLALIYYFGICKLPCKDDYWSTEHYMPKHSIEQELGMTKGRFQFMWRHFHVYVPTNMHDEDDVLNGDDSSDEEDNGGELVEQTMERVQREQETAEVNENSDLEEEDEENQEQPDEEEQNNNVWFDKLKPLIDHVRAVSYELIHTLGTYLSLDEMMIRFMGKSLETHRIKNKPIKEGYKFFVLSTINGFIVNFTPDGRMAAKQKQQEYKTEKSGKIESMILHVIGIIQKLKDKQKERINKYQRRLRKDGIEEMQEAEQKDFCLAMDNYFTLPNIITKLREMGIGVVGTARFRRSWPPSKVRQVKQEKSSFNDFYYAINEFGTLLGCWMDNGLVFCVSTIHHIGDIVKRTRKRPRETKNNKKHVKEVWGDDGKKDIYIPCLIDDYNHWMGGVDLSDQRIAYYHPDVRAWRNWVPMFIQILSIVRNNAYIVHREYFGKKAISHKKFTLEMISFLMNKAHETNLPETRVTAASSSSSPSVPTCHIASPNLKLPAKRKRLAEATSIKCMLSDFPEREALPHELHTRVKVDDGTIGCCIYCSALYNERKKVDDTADYGKEVKRTNQVCAFC